MSVVAGWLEKKSGGKEGKGKSKLLEKWDKRWFVLSGTEMRWYKTEDDPGKGKDPQGVMDCKGSELFLKGVEGQTFRFTVRTTERELKLRAPSSAYHMWKDALTPLAKFTDDADLATAAKREQLKESKVVSLDAIASAHDGYEAGGPEPTCTGWLDKKSGGKDGQSKAKLLEKWDKRWFALVGSELRYFKSEDDLAKGKAPAGSIECLGANVSLKKVKGQVFRFTVHTESRELRLRASSHADFHMWNNALSPLAKSVTEDAQSSRRDENDDDDEDADALPGTGFRSPHEMEEEDDEPQPAMLAWRQSVAQRNESTAAAVAAAAKRDSPVEEMARGDSFLARMFGGGSAQTAAAPQSPSSPSADGNPFGDSDGGGGAGDAGGNPFGDAPSGGNPFAGSAATSSATLPSISDDDDDDDERELAARMAALEAEKAAILGGGPASPTSKAAPGAGARAEPTVQAAPFKIIIVGDSGVGKTCLLHRFVEGRYDPTMQATVSVDISTTELDLGSSTVGLALWDTAGQERFAPLSTPYFRQADGVIIVFDVSKRSSFDRVLTYWVDEVAEKAEEDVSIMLIGSKADVDADERQVPNDEAQGFASEKGWLYFETSSKLGLHVRDAFYLLACTVMNRLNERDPKNLINSPKLLASKSGARGGQCCV